MTKKEKRLIAFTEKLYNKAMSALNDDRPNDARAYYNELRTVINLAKYLGMNDIADNAFDLAIKFKAEYDKRRKGESL